MNCANKVVCNAERRDSPWANPCPAEKGPVFDPIERLRNFKSMRFSILIFLLITGSAISLLGQQVQGIWYQVETTTHPEIWSARNHFMLYPPFPGRQSDTLMMGGFSNQGASVVCRVKADSLWIREGDYEIIPYGGDGRLSWTIRAGGKGNFKGELLELDFWITLPKRPEISGKISARRL